MKGNAHVFFLLTTYLKSEVRKKCLTHIHSLIFCAAEFDRNISPSVSTAFYGVISLIVTIAD